MCFLTKWLELLGYCINAKEAIRLTLNGERLFVLPHAIPSLSDGTFAFRYTRIKPDNTPEKSYETRVISISDISELKPSGYVLQGGKLVKRSSAK